MCYRGWPKLVILAAWLGAWGFLVAASCCGNGVVESGEACDDGANNGTTHACLSTCQWNVCGNGYICSDTTTCSKEGPTIVEQCDDGNTLGTDGCSATCLIERNYTCSGQPSVCTLNSGATGSTVCQLDTDPTSLSTLQTTLNNIPEWTAVLNPKAVRLGMTIDFSTRVACNEGGPTTQWVVSLPGSTPGVLTVRPEYGPYRVTLFWVVGSDSYLQNAFGIIHWSGTNPPEFLQPSPTSFLQRILDMLGPSSAYAAVPEPYNHILAFTQSYATDCAQPEHVWWQCAKTVVTVDRVGAANSMKTDASACGAALAACRAKPSSCSFSMLSPCGSTAKDTYNLVQGSSCLWQQWPIGAACLVYNDCFIGHCQLIPTPFVNPQGGILWSSFARVPGSSSMSGCAEAENIYYSSSSNSYYLYGTLSAFGPYVIPYGVPDGQQIGPSDCSTPTTCCDSSNGYCGGQLCQIFNPGQDCAERCWTTINPPCNSYCLNDPPSSCPTPDAAGIQQVSTTSAGPYLYNCFCLNPTPSVGAWDATQKTYCTTPAWWGS